MIITQIRVAECTQIGDGETRTIDITASVTCSTPRDLADAVDELKASIGVARRVMEEKGAGDA